VGGWEKKNWWGGTVLMVFFCREGFGGGESIETSLQFKHSLAQNRGAEKGGWASRSLVSKETKGVVEMCTGLGMMKPNWGK